MTTDALRTNELPESSAMPADFARIVEQRFGNIPMIPASAARALEVARDPNCSVQKFADLVETDVKLASEILAYSNSTIFAGCQPVKSVQAAIVRLGFRHCRNLILSCSAAEMMRQLSSEQADLCSTLTRHCFVTGLAANYYNRHLNLGFHGEEFTAGLIHDLGRMILATCAAEQFLLADALSFDEGPGVLDREQDSIGTDHTVIGSWYLMKNSVPAELVEVVRCHHDPGASTLNRKLVALVAIADDTANHMQRQEDPELYEIGDHPAIGVLQQAGVVKPKETVQRVAQEVMTAAWNDSGKVFAS